MLKYNRFKLPEITIKYWIIVFCIILGNLSLFAQNPYYYKFDENFGFPAREVYEILQSRNGHIWIASSTGLYHYNGNTLKLLKSEQSKGISLSGLFEDSKGRIWSRNFRGQIFYTEDNKLIEFINWEDSIRRFPSIYLTKNDKLWVTGLNGLYCFDIDNKSFNRFKIIGRDTLPDTDILNIYALSPTKAVFGNDNNYWGFINSGFLPEISVVKQSQLPENDKIARIFDYNGLTMYLSYTLQLYYKKDNQFFKATNLSNYVNNINQITKITVLSDNNLVIATLKGILVLDTNFNPVYNKLLFENEKISYVLEDKEGSLWISTLNNGVFVVPELSVFVYNKENSDLPEDGVYAIEATQNNQIWVGFRKGSLGVLDHKGLFTTIYQSNFLAEVSDIDAFKSNNNVAFVQSFKLVISENNRVKGYFSEVVSAAKSVIAYPDNIYCLALGNGVGIFYDKKMKYKFGSLLHQMPAAQPLVYRNANNAVDTKINYEAVFFRAGKKTLSGLWDTVANRIWGSFVDGMYYSTSNGDKEFLLDGKRIYANKMLLAANGLIWMGTSLNGILAIKDTSVVFNYHVENPIITLYLYKNHIWYTTMDGLFCLNIQTKNLIHINKYDGVVSPEITDIVIINGYVWLATPDGLVRFLYNKSFTNSNLPIVEISGIEVWEKSVLPDTNYVLPYNQNNIHILLNAIALKSRKNFTYKYRMLGINDKWLYLSGSNSLRFPSLPSGKYIFEVVAVNEDGFESAVPAKVYFHIEPPFWLTWWFITLIILAAVIILGILYKQRIQTINNRNKIEKQLKALEITAIKAQLNPHFIFNALNSIQALIIQNNIRLTNEYLGMFSDLLRMVLEESGNEYTLLSREINLLQLYLDLEKLRFEADFTYFIDSSGLQINAAEVLIPSMIIQPFAENALKHGLLHKHGHKTVKIIIKSVSNKIAIEVEDDGIGRLKSAEIAQRRQKNHKSFATSANSKRIDLINTLYHEKIELKTEDLYCNQVPCGTRVTVQFPIKFI